MQLHYNLTPNLTRLVIQAVRRTLENSPKIRLWISSRGNLCTAATHAMTIKGPAVAMRGTVHAGTVFV